MFKGMFSRMGKIFGLGPKKPEGPFYMGWHYVAYSYKEKNIWLYIEPMAVGKDVVVFPSLNNWNKNAPSWAVRQHEFVIGEMKRIAWNRALEWRSSDEQMIYWQPPPIMPGSVEATPAGRWLESRRLFHHDSSTLNADDVREQWYELIRKFCGQCSGTVRIPGQNIVKNSVLDLIEIPELKRNKKVVLVIC